MRVKRGQKLLSHQGDEWEVVKVDHPRPGRVSIRHHSGIVFDVDKHQLVKHAKKKRFWHRWIK